LFLQGTFFYITGDQIPAALSLSCTLQGSGLYSAILSKTILLLKKISNLKLQILNMPSFDIVSKVDAQALDNAVNVTSKEITNRFDFKGSPVVIDLNKKEFKIAIETEDEMKMRQLIDVLISRAHKQGIAPEAFDFSKEGYQSGKVWKKEVLVRNGLKQEDAKKIVKNIKDSGLKVQASINDDLVRVTGKKIDDLQSVIQTSKNWNLGIPLQYENMRD
jgi:uncharacterized protein YajQ (UPF0234 family)